MFQISETRSKDACMRCKCWSEKVTGHNNRRRASLRSNKCFRKVSAVVMGQPREECSSHIGDGRRQNNEV
ncbi:hypothetical protein KSS87_006633, partial [Heliosperma pusillum]